MATFSEAQKREGQGSKGQDGGEKKQIDKARVVPFEITVAGRPRDSDPGRETIARPDLTNFRNDREYRLERQSEDFMVKCLEERWKILDAMMERGELDETTFSQHGLFINYMKEKIKKAKEANETPDITKLCVDYLSDPEFADLHKAETITYLEQLQASIGQEVGLRVKYSPSKDRAEAYPRQAPRATQASYTSVGEFDPTKQGIVGRTRRGLHGVGAALGQGTKKLVMMVRGEKSGVVYEVVRASEEPHERDVFLGTSKNYTRLKPKPTDRFVWDSQKKGRVYGGDFFSREFVDAYYGLKGNAESIETYRDLVDEIVRARVDYYLKNGVDLQHFDPRVVDEKGEMRTSVLTYTSHLNGLTYEQRRKKLAEINEARRRQIEEKKKEEIEKAKKEAEERRNAETVEAQIARLAGELTEEQQAVKRKREKEAQQKYDAAKHNLERRQKIQDLVDSIVNGKEDLETALRALYIEAVRFGGSQIYIYTYRSDGDSGEGIVGITKEEFKVSGNLDLNNLDEFTSSLNQIFTHLKILEQNEVRAKQVLEAAQLELDTIKTQISGISAMINNFVNSGMSTPQEINDSLGELLKEVNQKVGDVNSKNAEYARVKQELDSEKSKYALLLDLYEQYMAKQRAMQGNITQLQAAVAIFSTSDAKVIVPQISISDILSGEIDQIKVEGLRDLDYYEQEERMMKRKLDEAKSWNPNESAKKIWEAYKEYFIGDEGGKSKVSRIQERAQSAMNPKSADSLIPPPDLNSKRLAYTNAEGRGHTPAYLRVIQIITGKDVFLESPEMDEVINKFSLVLSEEDFYEVIKDEYQRIISEVVQVDGQILRLFTDDLSNEPGVAAELERRWQGHVVARVDPELISKVVDVISTRAKTRTFEASSAEEEGAQEEDKVIGKILDKSTDRSELESLLDGLGVLSSEKIAQISSYLEEIENADKSIQEKQKELDSTQRLKEVRKQIDALDKIEKALEQIKNSSDSEKAERVADFETLLIAEITYVPEALGKTLNTKLQEIKQKLKANEVSSIPDLVDDALKSVRVNLGARQEELGDVQKGFEVYRKLLEKKVDLNDAQVESLLRGKLDDTSLNAHQLKPSYDVALKEVKSFHAGSPFGGDYLSDKFIRYVDSQLQDFEQSVKKNITVLSDKIANQGKELLAVIQELIPGSAPLADKIAVLREIIENDKNLRDMVKQGADNRQNIVNAITRRKQLVHS